MFVTLSLIDSLKKGSLLAWCVFSILCATGCQKNEAPPSVGEATVNGEKVSASEVYAAAMLANGPAILNRLVDQKLILQEAKRLNLAPDEDEYKSQVDHLKEQLSNPGLLKVAEQELKAQYLLQKILLKDIPDAKKKAFYKDFSNELKQYEVFEILVANKDVAEQVVSGLRSGTSFETLVSTSSIDAKSKTQKGRLGFATWRTLSLLFNQDVANAIEKLKPGAVTAPIALEDGGFVIMKLGLVRSSYDELKPTIENHLASAGRVGLMTRLVTEAKIESPYMPKAAGGAPVAKPPTERGARAPKEEPAVVAPGPNAGADPSIPLPKDNDAVPVPK